MIFLTLLALLYFLPTILASHRGYSVAPVLLLNLFFGWTGIAWFALLLYALLAQPHYQIIPIPTAYYPNLYRRL